MVSGRLSDQYYLRSNGCRLRRVAERGEGEIEEFKEEEYLYIYKVHDQSDLMRYTKLHSKYGEPVILPGKTLCHPDVESV